MSAATIDELTTLTMINMAGNFIGIPLAVITVKVIKDYSEVEPLLAQVNNTEEEVGPGGDYLSAWPAAVETGS